MRETVQLLGVTLDGLTTRKAIEHVIARASAGEGGWVLTPNLDILRRLVHEPDFARLCAGTTLRLPDGMPLIWASRLQGTPLPERVAGSDLIWSLSAAAAEHGLRLFFLGGNPAAAEATASILQSRHPRLQVAGCLCPAFGFEQDPQALAQIRSALVAADPHIVYVALGSPKQEQLIQSLRPLLPRAWFLGIGISFSFVAGEVARAPVWMQRCGLEWLHRLAQDPRRLFRRYFVHGIPFGLRLLGASAWRGLPAGA